MTEKDEVLATFRIRSSDWKDFQAIAKAAGTNATRALLEFIAWYRSGNRISQSDDRNIDNLEKLIDARINAISASKPQKLQTNLYKNIDTRVSELESKVSNIEINLDKIIDKLEAQKQPANEVALAWYKKVEVEMQQLESENQILRERNQNLEKEVSRLTKVNNDEATLQQMRDRVLKTLTAGKGKVATTSPQYKAAAKALDRFVDELRKSTPVSTQQNLQ